MNLQEQQFEVVRWIKHELAYAHARGIQDLLARTQYSEPDIQAALQALIDTAEIEVLEPVGSQSSASTICSFHPAAHFRLVCKTDIDYRWQMDLTERLNRSNAWSSKSFLGTFAEACDQDSNWLQLNVPLGV